MFETYRTHAKRLDMLQIFFYQISVTRWKKNTYAVGMHHWGLQEIPIDVVHCFKWNQPIAVAIYANEGFTMTVAYFKQEDSCTLYQLLRDK